MMWEWGYSGDTCPGMDMIHIPIPNPVLELVTSSYKKSFFQNRDIAISTCRAGNVIGGGDFAKDRIIPDCVRAMEAGEDIVVRNPYSTRPYQHVLEPVCTQFQLWQKNNIMIEKNMKGVIISDLMIVSGCVNTGVLTDLFCQFSGNSAHWINQSETNAPHEANFLRLDCATNQENIRLAGAVAYSRCYGENCGMV